MPRPTNEDLLIEIRNNRVKSDANHDEVIRRLGSVEEQVKHTNGRVKALEVESERRQAVEDYKKQQPTGVTINTKSVQWFESAEVKKFILALAALATAASAFLAYAVQQGAK